MHRTPRNQALRFAHLLRDKLQLRGLGYLPRWEVVSVFPETPFSVEPTEGAVCGAVLGQQDMSYLREALVELRDRLLPDGAPARDGSKWLDALHALWCETWTPSLRLGDRTRLREQELVALDAKQVELLDAIGTNPRLLVKGGAGTGKTLIARELYERMREPLREQGRQPLYLCSTNALAAGLRAAGVAHAWTVREYAAELLQRADIPMQNRAHRSAWSSETWELAPLQAAADAVPRLELRHGAVIVDEGQDMAENDWELVHALAGKGILWVFADAGQSFWADRSVPLGLLSASVLLTERYRCPEALARFADAYRCDVPPERPSSPVMDLLPPEVAPEPRASQPANQPGDGLRPSVTLADLRPIDELRVVVVPSATALAEKVALEIQKALGAGAHPSDVAVLSLAGQTRTKLAVASKLGSYEVVRADDRRASEHVVADTFLRFKGLERPWIIIAELGLGPNRYDVRMHVALTRATVGCVVLATREELDKDARLRAACS
jgi:hypothetical protein